jgi:hypothetical protein
VDKVRQFADREGLPTPDIKYVTRPGELVPKKILKYLQGERIELQYISGA